MTGPRPHPDLPDPDLRVTVVGGGHGLARTLTALRALGLFPTAVVSIADDGGSSGRLRRDYGGIAPGDLRHALSTLVPDPVARQLLEHRFPDGELGGHALGNLLLLAASDMHGGDTARGLEVLAGVFGTRGRVVPVADTPVDVRGELADGGVVHGQAAVASTPGVRRVGLVPDDVVAAPAALAAITEADAVVVGPGSLLTSLVPPLLVGDMGEALAATTATTVLVGNIREQPGETTGMDLRDHLDVLFAHLPDDATFDLLVANTRPHDDVAPSLHPVAGHDRIGRVLLAEVADDAGNHDALALAGALREALVVVPQPGAAPPDREAARPSDVHG